MISLLLLKIKYYIFLNIINIIYLFIIVTNIIIIQIDPVWVLCVCQWCNFSYTLHLQLTVTNPPSQLSVVADGSNGVAYVSVSTIYTCFRSPFIIPAW